jgi:hypothetical protein
MESRLAHSKQDAADNHVGSVVNNEQRGEINLSIYLKGLTKSNLVVFLIQYFIILTF